jgi:hypothetical protein
MAGWRFKDAGRVWISTLRDGIAFVIGLNAAITPRRDNVGAERPSLLSVVVLHVVVDILLSASLCEGGMDYNLGSLLLCEQPIFHSQEPCNFTYEFAGEHFSCNWRVFAKKVIRSLESTSYNKLCGRSAPRFKSSEESF